MPVRRRLPKARDHLPDAVQRALDGLPVENTRQTGMRWSMRFGFAAICST